MLILLVTIDGHTKADLARELREALRRVEAGEERGQDETEAGSYSFSIRSRGLPPEEDENQQD